MVVCLYPVIACREIITIRSDGGYLNIQGSTINGTIVKLVLT